MESGEDDGCNNAKSGTGGLDLLQDSVLVSMTLHQGSYGSVSEWTMRDRGFFSCTKTSVSRQKEGTRLVSQSQSQSLGEVVFLYLPCISV